MKLKGHSLIGNEKPSRERLPKLPHIRALVVEKEPALQSSIEEALDAVEIEAAILTTTAEAIERCPNEKYDVILIDVGPPLDGGAKLIRKIRKSGYNQKTPIIMISDDQRPAALAEGFEAEASFFVYKPIDKTHLARLIQVTRGTVECEQRRFRRVAVQTKAQVQLGERTLVGETIDISMNGTLVRVPRAFPLGSIVQVSLFIRSEANPVVGMGSVVRVLGDSQMGIQFERLPIAENVRLQEYLLPLIAG